VAGRGQGVMAVVLCLVSLIIFEGEVATCE